MDPFGNDFVHTVVECAKLAFADREAYYGDPEFLHRAARRAVVGRLQRRTPQAGRAQRVAGPATRHGARLHADGRSRRRGSRASADARAGRRRADRGTARRDRRRHLPSRRDRQGRQHGERHAVRRLAAILAGDSGTRLLHGHARADVLAAAGPAQQPGAAASARAPRCRRASRCATASRGWRSARRAASSRTSGR